MIYDDNNIKKNMTLKYANFYMRYILSLNIFYNVYNKTVTSSKKLISVFIEVKMKNKYLKVK